ncbi:MAG: N-succinylarginine dihydrolase [Chlamydiia bacterium]|nr:N-succinylarginine dihydrolase [Chlamydiia bacterium]
MNYPAYEVNFDGLPGPTHHFGGHSHGNIASMGSKGSTSSPKRAALQVLDKMKLVASLGVKQAILPPHERPHLPTLQRLGFSSIEQMGKDAPWLVPLISSSAAMWTANAATTTSSIDSGVEHIHFTPANLSREFHRAIEADFTARVLKKVFPNPVFFEHHDPLPAHELFFDEGAANHMRFCREYNGAGVSLFVYNQSHANPINLSEFRYPPRQMQEASEAIARQHQIFPKQVIFAEQNPETVNLGFFHADLLALSNKNVLFMHAEALSERDSVIEQLKEIVSRYCDTELQVHLIEEETLPLEDALNSYFFNSQLLSLPNGEMALICPEKCQQISSVKELIEDYAATTNNPISAVQYVPLNESMKNGGGPACLRLRVILNEEEIKEVHPNIFFDENLYGTLTAWVNRHYRDTLRINDLLDPRLHEEVQEALSELTDILKLGPLYPFQQT